MIAGTNTNCKILSKTITDSTATIELLFSANTPTSPSKGFKLYIQNRPTASIQHPELKELNNNIYWIDIYTYNNPTLNNVNINKYKQVKITVDITDNNSSKILDNRWVRECYIKLVDISYPDRRTAWSSELLTLISDRLITPQLRSFRHFEKETIINNTKTYTQYIAFDLYYESEIDYNYSNSNFYYQLNIKRPNTGDIIETDIQAEDYLPLHKEIQFSETYYDEPLIAELLIKNKSGAVVLRHSRLFKPTKKYSNTYVKTQDGIKKVVAFHIKKNPMEEQDE